MTHDPQNTPTPSQISAADDIPPFRYNAAFADTLESKWQAFWEADQTFVTLNPGQEQPPLSKARVTNWDQPKFYCLDMFPYPSGAGLHVGHPEGYTATDIICRYKRMKGFRVLHPMGWDAFGLPAEQYAIQTGVHPAITTRKAIDNFRRQLKRFGFSYDWSREFATIDEDYYRWTQWIWLRAYNSWYDQEENRARPISELINALESGDARIALDDEIVHIGPNTSALSALGGEPAGTRRWHELSKDHQRRFIDEHRLAYLDQVTVNWCPKLGTVLANEEVIDGKSERGGFPVYRRPLRQWVFRITAYAERLIDDLRTLDWPDSTKTMQAEWIGRSEGAELEFEIIGVPSGTADVEAESENAPEPLSITVFTTRPDTIFGVTYMVVAPEHPLVERVLAQPPMGMLHADVQSIRAYVQAARNRSDVDRQADSKEKTGAFLGVYAVNPANGAKIPVWVADYVLMGYGHGAIMAVPAHDTRDFEFAEEFGLPIRDVVYPRAVMALKYFAEHATTAEQAAEQWGDATAEFVDHVMSQDIAPAQFDEALRAVRHRRADEASIPRVTEVDTEAAMRELGAPIPEKGGGGAAKMTWRQAIDSLDLRSFEEMRRILAGGLYFADMRVAYTGSGYAVHSKNPDVTLDGLPIDIAKQTATTWAHESGLGRRRINYRLRDWLFSRQRYWGEPFPVVYTADGNHYPVGEDALPVRLPNLTDYTPPESDDPAPLLAKAEDWVTTTAGEAGVSPDVLAPDTPVRRETNTMPGWAGSCWYYLRYCDPRNHKRLISPEAERAWMVSRKRSAGSGSASATERWNENDHHLGGVDLYVGGSEHAVLHLLYARFWHKILFDLGEVSTPEPFGKLFHQGLITSFAYERPDKSLVAVDSVARFRREPNGKIGCYYANGTFAKHVPDDELPESARRDIADAATRLPPDDVVTYEVTPAMTTNVVSFIALKGTVAKMSKSLKNVVNPDDIIAEYGADTFRLYEMYMGPLEASKPWNTRDISGLHRFLQRAWRVCVNEQNGELRVSDTRNDAVERQLHKTIAKVGPDIERLAFNTGIAALIEFVNVATKADTTGAGALTRDQIERFALVMAPFTPHFSEELWSKLGHQTTLAYREWPEVDASMLVEDAVEVAVQILGKVRGKVMIPSGADEATHEAIALADEKIKTQLAGKTVRKVIVVPGRLVNIVAN